VVPEQLSYPPPLPPPNLLLCRAKARKKAFAPRRCGIMGFAGSSQPVNRAAGGGQRTHLAGGLAGPRRQCPFKRGILPGANARSPPLLAVNWLSALGRIAVLIRCWRI